MKRVLIDLYQCTVVSFRFLQRRLPYNTHNRFHTPEKKVQEILFVSVSTNLSIVRLFFFHFPMNQMFSYSQNKLRIKMSEFIFQIIESYHWQFIVICIMGVIFRKKPKVMDKSLIKFKEKCITVH